MRGFFVIITIILFLNKHNNAQRIHQPQLLIFFGASQTCKSSSIKLLTGNKSIICGKYGKGQSTTAQITIYKDMEPKMSKQYLYMDTIGLGDNNFIYTDQQIREYIQKQVLQYSNNNKITKIKAIILTQSYLSDANQLALNLNHLSKIFGYLPVQSIIILGTKSYDNKIQLISNRQNYIYQVMKKLGIKKQKFMKFITPYEFIEEDQIEKQQYANLQKLIQQSEPINLKSIQQKYNKIHATALKIQKQQLISKQIEVQVQKLQCCKKVPKTIEVQYENCVVFICNTRWRTVTIYVDQKYPVKVIQKKIVQIQRNYDDCYKMSLNEFERQMFPRILRKKIDEL